MMFMRVIISVTIVHDYAVASEPVRAATFCRPNGERWIDLTLELSGSFNC